MDSDYHETLPRKTQPNGTVTIANTLPRDVHGYTYVVATGDNTITDPEPPEIIRQQTVYQPGLWERFTRWVAGLWNAIAGYPKG